MSELPEVSLVAILDADKEGFLRNERSLIQTIGRAARNVNGHVIMYADEITDSMQAAIDETKRRRHIQEEYNRKHHITPKTIKKDIRDQISVLDNSDKETEDLASDEVEFSKMTKAEQKEMIDRLKTQMKQAAKDLKFEEAASLRDTILELEAEIG